MYVCFTIWTLHVFISLLSTKGLLVETHEIVLRAANIDNKIRIVSHNFAVPVTFKLEKLMTRLY